MCPLDALVAMSLVLIGCGGESRTTTRGDGTNEAGAPSSGGGGASGSAGAGALGGRGGAGGSTAGGFGGNGGNAGSSAGSATAGSSAGGEGGAPASIADVDDENADDGRPLTPSTSAIFWGSNTAGWRIGNWWITSDRTRDAGIAEVEPPRDGSTQARNVDGEGFAQGVVLWLELDHPGNGLVDLSGYSGISFWARLASESGRFAVALNDGSRRGDSLDRSTLPSRVLAAGPDWQEFTLPFDSFSVDNLSVASIEFFVGDGGEAFDLWIDDLAFLCPSACP